MWGKAPAPPRGRVSSERFRSNVDWSALSGALPQSCNKSLVLSAYGGSTDSAMKDLWGRRFVAADVGRGCALLYADEHPCDIDVSAFLSARAIALLQ